MKKTRPNSTSACNLIQLLRNRAEAKPSARAYVWLNDGEREGAVLSRAALEERARTIGIKLNCLTPKVESALLVFPPGLQFVEALFGCWYAGIIAIPAYVPRSNHDLARIEGMLKDSGCTIALTLREVAPYVQKAISAIAPNKGPCYRGTGREGNEIRDRSAAAVRGNCLSSIYIRIHSVPQGCDCDAFKCAWKP